MASSAEIPVSAAARTLPRRRSHRATRQAPHRATSGRALRVFPLRRLAAVPRVAPASPATREMRRLAATRVGSASAENAMAGSISDDGSLRDSCGRDKLTGARTAMTERPLAIINSVAPIRVCDNGGWTDTWFAGHGASSTSACTRMPKCRSQVYPQAGRGRPHRHQRRELRRTLRGPSRRTQHWDKHPLLEAADRVHAGPAGPALRGDHLLRSARRAPRPAPRRPSRWR